MAITALIVLPLIQLSPFSHLIGYASLGTHIALFSRFAAIASRGGILLKCLLIQTVTVFVLSFAVWAETSPELMIILLVICCELHFYLVSIFNFGQPEALIFIFGASVYMGL